MHFACPLLLLPLACTPKATAPPAPEGALTEVVGAVGLSDLATDPQGRLWAVAERPAALVRVDASGVVVLKITGLPEGVEPEALAIDADGAMRVGTEGEGSRADDGIYPITVGAGTAEAHDREAFPWAPWGLMAADNQGIEAMCAGKERWVAGEPVLTDAGRREAPLARWTRQGWQALRLPLQTSEGKISALACDPDDSLWAIERHYEELELLQVTVAPDGGVTVSRCGIPTWLRAANANWEGLAVDGDELVWVSDNQNATVSGPTRLARIPRRCVI